MVTPKTELKTKLAVTKNFFEVEFFFKETEIHFQNSRFLNILKVKLEKWRISIFFSNLRKIFGNP